VKGIRAVWSIAAMCACAVMVLQPLVAAGTVVVDEGSIVHSLLASEDAGNEGGWTNMTGDVSWEATSISTSETSIATVPDPSPLTVIPVVGEVTLCKEVENSSVALDSVVDDALSGSGLIANGDMELLDETDITVCGRIVYENVITSESANSLPKSNHPYPANANPNPPSNQVWHIYGSPDATQVMIFFSEVEIEPTNDHLKVKSSSGLVIWETYYQLYEDLWVTVPGNMATIELYSDATTQMWGFEVTKFVQNQYHYLGVPGVPVMIYDHDTWSGPDLLATVTTDNQGYFSAAGIDNDDPEGGTQDVYLYLESTSDHVRVIKEYGYVYSIQTERVGNVPDGSTVDFGNVAPAESQNSAWIVYSNLMDCWNTFANGGPGYAAPLLTAVWTLGHDASYNIGCSSDSHYDTGGLCTGEIHLSSEDGQDIDAILHECGHHIMFREYDNWLPGIQDVHYYDSNAPENVAWSEGWADFVPAAVGLYTGKGDKYFDRGGGYGGIFYSLETSQRTDSGSHPGDGVWMGGDTNEATISYSVYDMYDLVDDGTDTFDGGLSVVWGVLNDRRTNNFADFYDCFREHYKSYPLYIIQCHNAMKQGARGTINYDPVTFYDDFSDNDPSDWTQAESGGTVYTNSDPGAGMISVPGLKIEKPSSGAEVSAYHLFPPQGGDFVVDVKVKVSATDKMVYLLIMNKNLFLVYVSFLNDGTISYYHDGDWTPFYNNYQAYTWYSIMFGVHPQSRTFDAYVNGLQMVAGAPFDVTGPDPDLYYYADKVKFQAGHSLMSGVTAWVDEVTIRGGGVQFSDQFEENLNGWTQVETGGPVDWISSGCWKQPCVSLYKQYPTGQTQAFHASSYPYRTDGRVCIEARVSVSTIAQWKWCYLNLYDDGGVMETYLVLRGGCIYYYTSSGWGSTSFSYGAGSWFRVSLDADLETGTYDIYGNGVKIASGIALWDSSTAHNIAKVGLQAGAANLDGVYLNCDDIIVTWR